MAENAYKFEEKPRNHKGRMAVALGITSLFLFLTLSTTCVVLAGKAGAWTGAVGTSAFILSFFGMMTGLSSIHDRLPSYSSSKAGTLLCGFMVAVWFIIFCVGLTA
jgi:hypothetical protein